MSSYILYNLCLSEISCAQYFISQNIFSRIICNIWRALINKVYNTCTRQNFNWDELYLIEYYNFYLFVRTNHILNYLLSNSKWLSVGHIMTIKSFLRSLLIDVSVTFLFILWNFFLILLSHNLNFNMFWHCHKAKRFIALTFDSSREFLLVS